MQKANATTQQNALRFYSYADCYDYTGYNIPFFEIDT